MSIVVGLEIDLLGLARDFAGNPDQWPLAPRFDPRKRWYHRLAEHAGGEVWLLSWLPGQGTDWHDHGGSAGAFVVVSGELEESTPAAGGVAKATYRAGADRAFAADHVHRLSNVGRRPAVSVHVYGPALTSMTRYRMQANRLRVQGVDRAGVQW